MLAHLVGLAVEEAALPQCPYAVVPLVEVLPVEALLLQVDLAALPS